MGKGGRGEDMSTNKPVGGAQFTPGPWIVKSTDEDINTKTIIDSSEFWIARVLNFNHASDDIRESRANATLIAAAPAMYAELVNGLGLLEASYHDMCDKYGKDSMQAEVVWDQVERTRNVIAQAEGRHHE